MPGVTEREIAQAKQMNLYQYMQLCEPDNFKPEGPGQFRHKGHSSLSFAENGTSTIPVVQVADRCPDWSRNR